MKKTIDIEGKRINYGISHPYLEEINPEKDFVDIEVEFEGRTYSGSLTTTKFIDERLGHYGQTGENRSGSYFCAEGMIVVKRIDDETIRKTLEDLVGRGDLGEFLRI